MTKFLDTPYEAGNRGASWLKIKRVHTLDLVVKTQQFVMLGKTFKGLTATSHLRRRPTKAHRL